LDYRAVFPAVQTINCKWADETSIARRIKSYLKRPSDSGLETLVKEIGSLDPQSWARVAGLVSHLVQLADSPKEADLLRPLIPEMNFKQCQYVSYDDTPPDKLGYLLSCAITCSDVREARLLLRYGANADYRRDSFEHGWTPLHLAVWGAGNELARLLLDYGASPSIRDNDGKTAADLVLGNAEMTDHHATAHLIESHTSVKRWLHRCMRLFR
jgi:hypothetical protein